MCKKETEKNIVDTMIFVLTMFIVSLIIVYASLYSDESEKNTTFIFLMTSLFFLVLLLIIRISEHRIPRWIQYLTRKNTNNTNNNEITDASSFL
jgi:cell division protein FtsW (lipid II flippase)